MENINIQQIKNLRLIDNNNDSSSFVFLGIYNDKEIILSIKCSLDKYFDINQINKVNNFFCNDRFSKFFAEGITKLEFLAIYPATKEDYSKYFSEKIKILETPEMYANNIYPKILNQKINWIDNIFSGKNENNNILYSDNDFIFLPDIKWDLVDIKSLYYLVIFKNKNLKSIRDLNSDHLPLLNNIKNICCDLIEQKYKIKKNKIRMYFHYHPSFWQLHIHCNLINKHWSDISIDFSHSLTSVINNINLLSDYYKKSTLEVTINPNMYNI